MQRDEPAASGAGFAGRTLAVVSGGNRGIGLEVCRQLGERGMAVVLGSRSEAAGRDAALPLRDAGLDVRAQQLDVADESSVERFAGRLRDEHGHIDVLVNNAACDYDEDQLATTADLTRIERAWQVNTLGPWRLTLALLPLLHNSAHPRIVNVSSEGGVVAQMEAGTPAYHVTKAGLNALTRTLAAELRADGVLVNAVSPGLTATEMSGWQGRSPSEGAASVVWAALLPDDGPTAGFFRDGRALSW